MAKENSIELIVNILLVSAISQLQQEKSEFVNFVG